MSSLHISFSAEPLIHTSLITITNSMLVSVLVSLLLIFLAFIINKSIKKGKISSFQLFIEIIIEGFYNLTESIAGSRKTRAFFPFITTFFLFIIISNWSGLLPGTGSIGINKYVDGQETFVPIFRSPTADINTTLALALISMVLVQYWGFQHLHFSYFKKFFNFSSLVEFFVGILELISEFAKIISFAFRLFGNIFAGEVLLTVIGFLLPKLAPLHFIHLEVSLGVAQSLIFIMLAFIGLETFVGFIQALIFAVLSIVFFNMATLHQHDE